MPETAIDASDPVAQAAYDPAAAGLLRPMEPHLERLGDEFVSAFYTRLARDEQAGRILRALSDAAMDRLKQRQAEHLRRLTAPSTSREELLRRADGVGRAHALVGVRGSLLVRAQSLYRALLDKVIDSSELDATQRLHLSRIVEQRLHDDVQAQTEAAERVMGAYWRVLARSFAALGTRWPDVAEAELQALGELPGIRAVLLLRLGHDGMLTVERSAGPDAQVISQVMQHPSTSVLIDARSPRGQGLAALAWRSGLVHSTPSYLDDPRLGFWHEQAQRLGLQSTFAVPVLGSDAQAVACLYLYGAFPHQFECDWMREFGRGLQHRWEQAWQRCGGASARALPQGLADEYRRRLFDGGLTMYAQPVLDLRSGHVHSLEALARLRMPDGTVLGPGQFLPLLGHAELDALFRLGLHQVLDWAAAQPTELARLGLSINLAPSTLLNPDCVRWISDALQRHGVAPRRLHIELLETQELNSALQRQQLEQLASLGVRLSMDDLGSGYSSLERLSRLPFDVIKIDQALLASIRTQPMRVLSLVGSLIQMAHDLQREAVVEGLEDDDAVEAVSLLGATLGQGFGICRPMPLEQASAWLLGFRAHPMQPAVRTRLGALAYHWRYLRDRRTPSWHSDLSSCPMTGFLRSAAGENSDVARWHALLHAGGADADEAGRRIGEWLVRSITGA